MRDRPVTVTALPADEAGVWALWVLGGLVVWLLVAAVVGIVIGRGIRLADRREAVAGLDRALTTADLPGSVPASVSAAAPRRAVPLPPMGVALAAIAVVLETTGYVLRLQGATGPVARALSMDAPLSLPRMFVAALFAASAVAALVGAGTLPGRRSWWTAVGVVTGLIASVKAGGTIHAAAMVAMDRAIGRTGAQVVSVFLVVAVIGTLWHLSRTERRDRRRVLGSLGLYAVAAVGLSGLSTLVAILYGPTAAAAATYIEESGEALSGIAVVMAVLVGVAPRLVLPAAWPLRREADAHTVDAQQPARGRTAER